MKTIIKYLPLSFLILLAYLPFHALTTTFIISRADNELLVKGIKDLYAITIFVVAVIFLLKNKNNLKTKKMMLLASPIMLLTLVVIAHLLINDGQASQEKAFGALLLLRSLWIFFAGVIIASIAGKNFAENKVIKTLIIGSTIVAAFGALQVMFLPKDFLANFGYGESTIRPYQTIDNNESFVRILSTLRGPNPLGAYLAMLAPLCVFYASKIKDRQKLKVIIYGILFFVTIYGAQSRSAWIGLFLGLATYIILTTKNKYKLLKYSAFLIPILMALYLAKDTYLAQNILFHADPREASQVNSDDQRLSSIKYAVNSINEKPLGHGVGSSGPASNYGYKPVIIENQYLDIAYQIGWLGLVFYISLITSIGISLYKLKTKLSYAVLSGLVAISAIALFWPVWNDDTVTMIWWGLAGVVLSTSIVQAPKKR